MDTGTHLRAIWRRRWWVLGGALLTGLAVFALRTAVPATYVAEATLFLVPGERLGAGDPDAEATRLTTAYVELGQDPVVVADVARRTALAEPTVRQRFAVSSDQTGEIIVRASMDTAEGAVQLAASAGDAVSSGARRDQAEVLKQELGPLDVELAAIRRQLTAGQGERTLLAARQERLEQARADRLSTARARLDVVVRPRLAEAVRTPQPLRDAGLAGVLALIVLAEGAAIVAARRRGVEGRDPVPTLEGWTPLPVFRIGASRYGPDEAAAALRFLGSDRTEATVLLLAPLTSSRATAEGITEMLGTLRELRGRATWWDLGAPDVRPETVPRPVPGVERVRAGDDGVRGLVRRAAPDQSTIATAEAWEAPALYTLLGAVSCSTCLVVDPRSARRDDVLEAVRVLGYAGADLQALLVVDGRSRSRRAARRGADRPALATPVPLA